VGGRVPPSYYPLELSGKLKNDFLSPMPAKIPRQPCSADDARVLEPSIPDVMRLNPGLFSPRPAARSSSRTAVRPAGGACSVANMNTSVSRSAWCRPPPQFACGHAHAGPFEGRRTSDNPVPTHPILGGLLEAPVEGPRSNEACEEALAGLQAKTARVARHIDVPAVVAVGQSTHVRPGRRCWVDARAVQVGRLQWTSLLTAGRAHSVNKREGDR